MDTKKQPFCWEKVLALEIRLPQTRKLLPLHKRGKEEAKEKRLRGHVAGILLIQSSLSTETSVTPNV